MSAPGVISSQEVFRLLSDEGRKVQLETAQGDAWEFGTHWVWMGREIYTAQGLACLADALDAVRLAPDAVTLRRYIPAKHAEPAGGASRKASDFWWKHEAEPIDPDAQ